jgi:putative spermidine/putrescine transport system ATP-binding protein
MLLSLDDVGKDFGAVTLLAGVTLDVNAGELLCLLGPSGSGKTTLLRLIAGLERPSRGRILLAGDDLTEVPAHRRNFGMVFQSLALFPHLTVGENIGYGLRIRGVDAARRRARTDELLELVRLPGLAGRPVSALSGGQCQRVAIARALAVEPRLFLLDEPLSALDAGLREAMQIELRLLQRRLGITTIVTHDQREAMTIADRIAVIGDGELRQVGAPLDVYRRPASRFVAEFIGQANILSARWDGGVLRLLGTQVLPPGVSAGADGESALLAVRPEDVVLSAESAAGTISGRVTFVRDVGASVEVHIDCEGTSVIAVSGRHDGSSRDRSMLTPGSLVFVSIPADAAVALPL